MTRVLLVLAGAIAVAFATPARAAGRPARGAVRLTRGAAPVAPADPVAAALGEGDAAFAARAAPARLEAALDAYRRAQRLRPGQPDVELRLARAEAFRALAAEDPAAAREAWDASARAGERALRTLAPRWAKAVDDGDAPEAAAAHVGKDGAEALYWLALGAMRGAQATGYAAVLAVKTAALGMMDRVVALDERVDAAGPHRALGGWRAALPIAAGGGATRSRSHFDRARALFPQEQLGRVLEAETYAVLVQDRALFDRLLDEVKRFDVKRWPERAAENAVAKRRAEALRAKRGRLF